MRNRDAARYARWAAIAAALIAVVVGGVYAKRALRRFRALRNGPVAVSVDVQQQSAQFSFSKVEQSHTIFTVRASHATQYKEENRAVLEDVWITLYGRDGSRNDNIHTRECSYDGSGDVRCEGEVTIDMANANPASARPFRGHGADQDEQFIVQPQHGRGVHARAGGISFRRRARARRGSFLQHERFDRASRTGSSI